MSSPGIAPIRTAPTFAPKTRAQTGGVIDENQVSPISGLPLGCCRIRADADDASETKQARMSRPRTRTRSRALAAKLKTTRSSSTLYSYAPAEFRPYIRLVLRAATRCGAFQLFGIRSTMAYPLPVSGTAFMRNPAMPRFKTVAREIFQSLKLLIGVARKRSEGCGNPRRLVHSDVIRWPLNDACALTRFYVFMSGQPEAFSAMHRISAAPQSRPWSARRDDIAHSVCQEGRRFL